MSYKAQRALIVDRLRQGPMTTRDGFEMGILRLAARVFELRESGYEIATHWDECMVNGDRKRVACYVLLGAA